jgi:energy-coupling factor transport system permease protein
MSSRFEFLGSTAIGQYIPRQSWIHRCDPRARLLAYLALFVGVVFTRDFVGLVIGLGCVLVFYQLAQIPLKPALKGIKRALPFLLILALLQILLGGRTDTDLIITNIFGFGVTQRSVFNASMLLARFSVLIVLINGFVMTLSTAQITAALFYLLKPAEAVRFPVNDLLMVVQITMRYLPLIAQTAEKIAKAQAARGGDWEQRGFNPIRQAKRVLPLIVPLIVHSLKRAETMALAMESRGFNAGEKRSSFYALQFSWMDGAFLISTTAISALMILSMYLR